MVGDDNGDDDLNVYQHQTEGQHNLQWMDTLIGHTSCAIESGAHGQHTSLGAPVSARAAEWQLVSSTAQHNGAGSSSADTMRMNRNLLIFIFNYFDVQHKFNLDRDQSPFYHPHV